VGGWGVRGLVGMWEGGWVGRPVGGVESCWGSGVGGVGGVGGCGWVWTGQQQRTHSMIMQSVMTS
jgi:hypothetical protein